MTPNLIITRPADTAAHFASAVLRALGQQVPVVYAPAFQIMPLAATIPDGVAHVIFTSVNGVAQADRLNLPRVMAWCVGDRTAQAARDAGFDAVSAHGSADDLVALIAAHTPTGKMAHIAGQEARGDVAAQLHGHGLNCQHIVAYRQVPCPPTKALSAAAQGTNPNVTPVFSANSAAMLATVDWHGPVHAIAMSVNIAIELSDLGFDTVVTTKTPTEDAMIDGTCTVLQVLLDR